MIRVQNLQKRFGSVIAVNDASFTAADGAIMGLLGANGAGKTTTLAMICGLLAPDRGSVMVDGKRDNAADRRRQIGALLDHHGLSPRLTVRENIVYFGALQGLSGAALERHVDDVIERLGLGPLIDRRAAALSQGERLKVALARAVVHGPRHVLLDEPTNGLDVPTVRNLRALLRDMRDEGRCIIFSSHVLQEVRALCDQIVVIAGGRVVAEGSAEAIARRTGADTLEDAFVTLIDREERRSWLPV